MSNEGKGEELTLADVQHALERTHKRLVKRKVKLSEHVAAQQDFDALDVFVRVKAQEMIDAERAAQGQRNAPVRKLPSKEAIERAVREAKPEGPPVQVKEISLGANNPKVEDQGAAKTA